jgi:hypothetical protein
MVKDIHHVRDDFTTAFNPLRKNFGGKFLILIKDVVEVIEGRILDDVGLLNIVDTRFFHEGTEIEFSLIFRDVELDVFFVKLFDFFFFEDATRRKNADEFSLPFTTEELTKRS